MAFRSRFAHHGLPTLPPEVPLARRMDTTCKSELDYLESLVLTLRLFPEPDGLACPQGQVGIDKLGSPEEERLNDGDVFASRIRCAQ
jgi:hypothetical protein